MSPRRGAPLRSTETDGIVGQQQLADGSHRFRFQGGPYDGMTFRLYPPFEPVAFNNRIRYEPCPPSGRATKWTYTYVKENP